MSSAISRASRSSCLLVAALGFAVPGAAQIFPTYPWPQQQPQIPDGTAQQGSQNPQSGWNPNQQVIDPNVMPWTPRADAQPFDPDGLFPTWVRPDAFLGFPQFPPNLGAMAMQPMGFGPLPGAMGQLPPPAVPTAPDWPAWIRRKQPGALPYEPNVAVLVRQADRVWFRTVDEDAAVPLYHYDNARALTEGAEVEVRRTGEFLLLLHGGSRIASFGDTKATIGRLDADGAAIEFAELTWLDLSAARRGMRCRLPDGSELELPPVSVEQEGQPGSGDANVRIERAVEPGQYHGRAVLFNQGARPVIWHTAFGEVTLVPGQRITFFLSDSTKARSCDLREESVAAMAQGQSRVWEAVEDGAVTWSGARFALPTGAKLRLDPLLGDPFAARAKGLQRQSPPAAGERDR